MENTYAILFLSTAFISLVVYRVLHPTTMEKHRRSMETVCNALSPHSEFRTSPRPVLDVLDFGRRGKIVRATIFLDLPEEGATHLYVFMECSFEAASPCPRFEVGQRPIHFSLTDASSLEAAIVEVKQQMM
jgi:hypothetical protein